jgi:hypothetical protein
MSVRHKLPWCWHRLEFYIGCDPARVIAGQVGHNLHVRSLDTPAKNSHAASDDVDRNTQGNLQALMVNLLGNA